MRRRLAILTEIISPYRIPVFNALAKRGDIDLHVIFLAETDPSVREWRVYKDEIQFCYEVLPSFRRRLLRYNVLLNWNLKRALRRADPQVVLCGGLTELVMAGFETVAGRAGTSFHCSYRSRAMPMISAGATC